MKLNYFKSIALAIPFLAVNVFAFDEFFGNFTRVELFEHIDFTVPNLKIKLSDYDYKTLFLSYQCKKDATPGFLKKNEECYRAPYIDYCYAIERATKKNYLDKSKITDPNDLKLVEDSISRTHQMTYEEFKNIVEKYSSLAIEEILSLPYGLISYPEKYFEARDKAGLVFEIEGEETKEFQKVKFKVGGRSTRFFSKIGYNINIKDENDLYGARNLRLRAVTVDPSFLRDKMAYDLHNRIDLPCISANYVKLYINDVFMGLYLLRDAYKPQWIESYFGEKDTKHLYTCSNQYSDHGNDFFKCINDDDSVQDDQEFKNFLKKLENSKTRKDIEEFFDVKTFIRLQAARYLYGSLDHITGENNNVLYMYHNTVSGKDLWIPLIYDFDMNFGNFQKPNPKRTFEEEIIEVKTNPLYKLLKVDSNSKELIGYMDEIMRSSFNPEVLLERIDQLKNFIDPYVKEDRTPGENGRLPGRFDIGINRSQDLFTYDDFLNNSEFTTLVTHQYENDFTDEHETTTALGLKQWVIERFRFACEHYNIDCSYAKDFLESPYANTYKVDTVLREQHNKGCKGTGYGCCVFKDTIIETIDGSGKWGHEGGEWCLMNFPDGDPAYDENCWALAEGYPCCKNEFTEIIYTSDRTGYSWGKENDDWCGITDLQKERPKRCPISGTYKCCQACDVVYTDDYKWGFENNDWCLTPYHCEGETTH